MSTEFYNELRNPSRRNYDRYKNCKLLEDVSDGSLILSTLEINEVPSHPNDIYHRVMNHETSRLDKIAHQYYQNPLLWWVIALANNISDPFIPLEPGSLIRVPSMETLYGNNGILL